MGGEDVEDASLKEGEMLMVSRGGGEKELFQQQENPLGF